MNPHSEAAQAAFRTAMGEATDAMQPEPLRAALLPAKPFPVDALGVVLGEAAKAINESV